MPAEGPESPIVERTQIQGNRYLQQETYLFYVSTKPGNRFDLLRLRDDFRRLWNTGFLEDLAMDVSEGQAGVVVTFIVQERKRIQIVDYRGSKELKRDEIEKKLEETDAKLRLDSFYDINAARKVESVIKRMLAEKGHRFAEVSHDTRVLGGAGMQISFTINDGPKAKVNRIEFVGNEIFSDGALRGKMKKIKQPSFFGLTWLKGNTKFTDEKWDEDSASIRDFYLEKGYVDAQVGKPTLTYVDDKPDDPQSSKKITLSIPVDEGERYRVGEIDVEGLTVFREEWVRSLIKLREGQYYDDSKVQKALEELQEAYGRLGHFQFTGYPERRSDLEKGTVDVTLHLDEDERYFVGKISFVGNDTTRDKVVRREIFLNEGDPFNTELLELSMKRINQLGYFKPLEKAPGLAAGSRGEHTVDVTFELEEQNRNQVALGGGFSELDGAFVNLSFQTANFLGRGEAVGVAVQTGSRSTNHRLSFTTPYLLDRPITAGLEVYFNRITYLTSGTFVGFGQQTQGAGLTLGKPVGRFSRALLRYSYQIVDVYEVDTGAIGTTLSGVVANDVLNSPIASGTFDLDAFGGAGRRFESALSPTWIRDTVDDPYRPRSGTRLTSSLQLVGGVLGGTVNLLRPTVEAVGYKPFGRRMALGVRAQAAFIKPYGSTTEIPYYQRYFLGGENQIRGFNLRSVAPYDVDSQAAVGGNKFMLFNAEWYVDVLGPVRFLAFFDAGQAYPEGQGFYWGTMSTSTGVEFRMLMPVINVPFRLIQAWNLNRDYYQPAKAFKFAVGTTF